MEFHIPRGYSEEDNCVIALQEFRKTAELCQLKSLIIYETQSTPLTPVPV